MIRSRKKSIFKVLGLLLLCCLMVVGSSLTAFADDEPIDTLKKGVGEGAAIKDSDQDVLMEEISTEKYKKVGGGSYTWSQLINGNGDIDSSKYNELTSTAQNKFISDVSDRAYAVEASNDDVTEDTINDWWTELQNTDGLGTKFFSVIVSNTKPNFVAANNIYKPFSGIVGTVLGLIAILVMGFLGIVMVADISYITIPPVRMAVADGQDAKGGKLPVSKVFSHDAIYAVQVSEAEGEGGGSPKQALGVYLGRRVPMLILLGICLLYLVSGNIYTLVGYILDLVSGFLGF